jgi:hypothetical protein
MQSSYAVRAMADDNRIDSSLERRKFLALLGVAGTYAPPTLVGLLQARTVFGAAVSTSVAASGSSQLPSTSLSSSLVSTSAGSSASSFPQCGESSVGGGTVLFPTADTFIRRQAKTTNEGANPLIRVGVAPVSRGLVLFDRNALYNSLSPACPFRVLLVLRIANNRNNWGQYDDRTVSVHPLFDDFIGGNGAQSGMPGFRQHRGTGAGATWNSPADPDVSDDTNSGATNLWNGAADRVAKRKEVKVVHRNQVEGVDVVWDVTADVTTAGGFLVAGWMLRVDNEPDTDDETGGGPLPAGFDRGSGGTVEYFSSEGAAAAGHPVDWAPRLIIS